MNNGQQARYHMVPGGDNLGAPGRAGPGGVRRGASPLSPSTASVSHESNESLRRGGGGTARSSEDAGQELGPYSHLRKGSARGMSNNPQHYKHRANGNGQSTNYGQQAGYGQRSQYAPSQNGSRTTTAAAAGPGLASGAATLSDRSGSSQFNSSGSASERKALFDASPQGGYVLGKNEPEADDYLHNPDARGKDSSKFICCSWRGILNVTALVLLVAGLLALFAGYPIISHFTTRHADNQGAFGIGGTNGTGQVPVVLKQLQLIDKDTPASARTWTSPETGDKFHLVFSDEFEEEGRTFWPGDDPFWEGVDIWYGATGDYEWYSPEQLNTTGGALQITLEAKPMHDLNFRSGMLQSWRKFCFQGGYIEFNAILPGSNTEVGWWPGLWTMGNLARPGYLGTTDGMWPYSYDSCDSGTLMNQTARGSTGYQDVSTYGSSRRQGLNWLNGQRASACTCRGEDHPGPNTGVGRAAPELDILEAQIRNKNTGQVSQSVQVAPFDMAYEWSESAATIYDNDITILNSYKGGVYQEAGSAVSTLPNKVYARAGNTFTTFGVDYTPDFNKDGSGRVTWYMDGKPTWTVTGAAFPPRRDIDISRRLIPVEPMSIIMNLGISRGFQDDLDFDTLNYPAVMSVDYVRVYQPDSYPKDLVSCDPDDHPTEQFIKDHLEVYMNANYTTWPKTWPKNSLKDGC